MELETECDEMTLDKDDYSYIMKNLAAAWTPLYRWKNDKSYPIDLDKTRKAIFNAYDYLCDIRDDYDCESFGIADKDGKMPSDVMTDSEAFADAGVSE